MHSRFFNTILRVDSKTGFCPGDISRCPDRGMRTLYAVFQDACGLVRNNLFYPLWNQGEYTSKRSLFLYILAPWQAGDLGQVI